MCRSAFVYDGAAACYIGKPVPKRERVCLRMRRLQGVARRGVVGMVADLHSVPDRVTTANVPSVVSILQSQGLIAV